MDVVGGWWETEVVFEDKGREDDVFVFRSVLGEMQNSIC